MTSPITTGCSFESPLGELEATFLGEALTRLDFGSASGPEAGPARAAAPAALSRPLRKILDQVFAADPFEVHLPMAPHGTAFQHEVWSALREIPWGETRSYGEIARAIGRPEAVRAVAQAVGRNPIAILIPCHRVIGSTCTLTGYAGGLARKRTLLELEGAVVGGTHARGRVSRAELLGAAS